MSDTDATLIGKLKSFLGGGSSSSEEATTEKETAVRSESETSSSSSADPSATAETKPVKKDNTIPLELNVKLASIPPMSVAEKRAARDRLMAIDRLESGKRAREEARNSLEGYLYRVRDLLEDDSTESPFVKCSQQAERKAMEKKLQESFAWLSEHDDDALTKDFIAQRSALE